MHSLDGRDQILGIHGLEQIAAGARPDGVEHVLLLAIHGQRDDTGGRGLVQDLADGFHTVHIGHDDIHQDHIWLGRARQRHRLGAVLGLGHHEKPPSPSQSWRKPWRTRVWSSAIRSLIDGMSCLLGRPAAT